jgi:DNA-binding PadR family transcriptional regulator
MTSRKQRGYRTAKMALRRADVRGRELAALLLPFYHFRILRYAATGPIQPPALLQKLRRQGHSLDGPPLQRILRRLARQGWLKYKTHAENGRHTRSEFILTPRGRTELDLARERLRRLSKILNAP